MLEQTGVATSELVARSGPSSERLAKGPVAIVECFQRIPCDPCAAACARKAIQPMQDINDTPSVDFERCNGCALCVSACPGLAIFVVDMNHGPYSALVKMPYEFRPFPAVDEMVLLLNREGKSIGEGRIQAVDYRANQNKTAVVSVVVPKEAAMEIRAVRRMAHQGAGEGR